MTENGTFSQSVIPAEAKIQEKPGFFNHLIGVGRQQR